MAEGIVTVSVKATKTGYTDLTAEDVTIQITKKPATITVNNAEKFFNEADPVFTGTVTKLVADGDLGTITSVSYTHLDVYKRQVLLNEESYAKAYVTTLDKMGISVEVAEGLTLTIHHNAFYNDKDISEDEVIRGLKEGDVINQMCIRDRIRAYWEKRSYIRLRAS